MAQCDSRVAAAAKVQHDPQCPWFLTGLKTEGLASLQSNEAGTSIPVGLKTSAFDDDLMVVPTDFVYPLSLCFSSLVWSVN